MTYLLRLRCRLQTARQTALQTARTTVQTALAHPDVQELTERAADAVLNAGTGNYADAVQDALHAALIPALHLLDAERRQARQARQPPPRSTAPADPDHQAGTEAGTAAPARHSPTPRTAPLRTRLWRTRLRSQVTRSE